MVDRCKTESNETHSYKAVSRFHKLYRIKTIPWLSLTAAEVISRMWRLSVKLILVNAWMTAWAAHTSYFKSRELTKATAFINLPSCDCTWPLSRYISFDKLSHSFRKIAWLTALISSEKLLCTGLLVSIRNFRCLSKSSSRGVYCRWARRVWNSWVRRRSGTVRIRDS